MQYFMIGNKSQHFLVTPDELRLLLSDFHHVIINTGVPKNYTESDPNTFFSTYDALYNKLKAGEKLIWRNDYKIARCTIGITQHLQNCIYYPSNHLRAPYFLEPCPWIATFSFTQWNDQLCTSFSVEQTTENICGLCVYFPAKIEFKPTNIKYKQGVVSCTELDDFETYEILLSRIKKITKLLNLELNGRIRRTKVRISDQAKKDLVNFNFIASNGVKIL